MHFVSDAVALDAFSQCHGFVLRGHPITVNLPFKPNNSTATIIGKQFKASLAEKALIRPEAIPLADIPLKAEMPKFVDAPPPKVLIKTVVDSESDVEDCTVLPMDVLTHARDAKATVPKSAGTPTPKSVHSPAKAVAPAVVKPSTPKTSLISQMFKQAVSDSAANEQEDISSDDDDEDDESGDSEGEANSDDEGIQQPFDKLSFFP